MAWAAGCLPVGALLLVVVVFSGTYHQLELLTNDLGIHAFSQALRPTEVISTQAWLHAVFDTQWADGAITHLSGAGL